LLAWLCPAALADIVPEIRYEWGTPNNLTQLNGQPEVLFYECFEVSAGIVKLNLNVASGNNTMSGWFQVDVVDTPHEVAGVITDLTLGQPPVPVTPCPPTVIRNYGALSGNVGLYAFAIGGGLTGGFTWIERASSSVTLNDNVIVAASETHVIEAPLAISGSVLGAESFGNPDQTWGKATLSMSGFIGPQGFDERVSVESVSVIPTEASIDVETRVPIPIGVGQTALAISVNAQATVEAQAQSTGLFGTISGAATAAVSFPHSVEIMRFTGAGGGALPRDVLIQSAVDGYVYESTVRGDLNCDGLINFFDIDPFVMTLFDPSAYETAYAFCHLLNADVDASGAVNFFDIDPFINLLF
jgi:hypothetical protein